MQQTQSPSQSPSQSPAPDWYSIENDFSNDQDETRKDYDIYSLEFIEEICHLLDTTDYSNVFHNRNYNGFEADFIITLLNIEKGKTNSKDIVRLNLSYNHYPSLHLQTIKLCSLTYLDISNNGKLGDTIPAPILTLSSLIYLNASKCNFTHVTDEIKNMKCLQYLNLEDNDLNMISERIAELPLEVLKLSYNKLIDMPHQMIDMKTLIYLDLSYNKFENFTFIYSLKSLRTLILTKTKMTSISSEISNLINLRYLIIDRNTITTLPVEICSLVSLIELEIQDNNIEKLPNEIGNLKNLNSLGVHDNNLSELPISFVNLKKLKYYQLDTRINDRMNINMSLQYKCFDRYSIRSEVFPILFKEIIKYHQINAAIVIQKHIRGNLIRNKFGVHNPNCSNGKHFILRMFIITKDYKE
jgi:hypothetical protein